ncbi:WXG100 family type VII secretion target [Kutzneria buriramensis]|uniref:ESAT-6-like protein n=1 Tax=Kutzneria buriramensis TaxID=1045776 RepID=A0A3E0IAB4_9PSEU|nr:WXG100 family type VII secretion target [Kutzneria buriramensis]REH55541.1 early secretory antigenic target protein ESAT-6 [Kutzneria buriramensis]
MADSSIKVTFAEIQQAASDINSASQQIDSHLDQLKAKIAPIVADWTGDAAEAYQVAQKNWDDAAKEFNQTLQAIGIAVRDAGSGYEGAEGAAKKLWG